MRINSDYQQNFDFIPIQIDFESSEYLINTLRKKFMKIIKYILKQYLFIFYFLLLKFWIRSFKKSSF